MTNSVIKGSHSAIKDVMNEKEKNKDCREKVWHVLVNLLQGAHVSL